MYAKNDSVLICAATKSTYTSLLKVGDFLKDRIKLHQLSLDSFIYTMYVSHNSIIKFRKFSYKHLMLKLREFNSLWRWDWPRYILRKPNTFTSEQALKWKPQGKQKRGGPRNSWWWSSSSSSSSFICLHCHGQWRRKWGRQASTGSSWRDSHKTESDGETSLRTHNCMPLMGWKGLSQVHKLYHINDQLEGCVE